MSRHGRFVFKDNRGEGAQLGTSGVRTWASLMLASKQVKGTLLRSVARVVSARFATLSGCAARAVELIAQRVKTRRAVASFERTLRSLARMQRAFRGA